jgi:hypothetical protein
MDGKFNLKVAPQYGAGRRNPLDDTKARYSNKLSDYKLVDIPVELPEEMKKTGSACLPTGLSTSRRSSRRR